MLRRANFLTDEMDYDSSDPEGYRSGQIHITKAIGAQALAVMLRRDDGAVDYYDGET
jgi:hypothetical protein